ncbi:MAG TPA: pilin [Candidatus Saccharimonadales bacterium]|nr:pilin [Candidatus Saccharimonadales bacterium]
MRVKKIFLALSLLIMILAPTAFAQAACNWRPAYPLVDLETEAPAGMAGCHTGEKEGTGCDNTKSDGFICCCDSAQSPLPPPKFQIPELQIDLGEQIFSQPTCTPNNNGTYQCKVNWLGEYLTWIYNYALKIAGILAAVMLMAGGLLWLVSGGDAGKVGQAKEIIIGSITGLIILLSSYVILTQINPNLIKSSAITLGALDNQSTLITTGWSFDPGIINQVGDANAELSQLLNCMRAQLPDGIGRISSISDSNHIGNLSTCNTANCTNCVHTCGSCHYGGGSSTNKSYAVDFGDEENIPALSAAAKACDSEAWILEEFDKISNKINHLHVSISACPRQ